MSRSMWRAEDGAPPISAPADPTDPRIRDVLEGGGSIAAARAPASVVGVTRTVDCPFSFALENAPLVFPMLETAEHGRDATRRSMRILVGGVLGRRVTVTFRDRPDASEPGRPHDEIGFTCVATARWLPEFSGVLRFRPAWMQTRLTLGGDYVPRFGPLGRLADRAGGRVLARLTASDVLARIATLLERRWTFERGKLATTSFGDAATGPHAWLER